MPLVFDDEQSPASAPASGSGRLVFDDEAPKAVSKSRSAADIARDVGVTALKGAVALPESIVGLADIPTGGRVGKALEGAGVKFKETQDILSGQYSEQQQAANKKVQEADGFVNTAVAALQNPSTIATAIGESIPQMLGGAGVARLGIKAAEKVGRTVAPWIAGAVGEGTMAAGSAAENMRQESADGLLSGKQTVSALGSGAGTAILGAAGGKIAQKFGFGDMDTILAQGGANAVAAGAAKKGFLRQMAEGGISEGVFEEMPQSIQETMWQNWANDKPLMEGTGNAAAMGMLAGIGMGMGGGGYNAAMSRVAAQDQAPFPATETGITDPMPDAMPDAMPAQELVADEPQPTDTTGVENGATDQGGQVSQVAAQGVEGASADVPGSGSDSQAGLPGELAGRSGGAGISGTADGSAVPAGSAGVPGVTADTTAADALMTPKAITALDRVTELDTEATRLQAREAELSADNGYGEMFDTERQDVAARRAELAKERESITASWPKAITGHPTSFSTEAGVRLDAQYALMDAGELTTSHDENLRPTPTYPPELQPRQRDRAASEMQIAGIVQRLDPARLGESADAANGAPIVGADGLVESGNGRTIALKRIYQAKGQRADEYKQFLKENAQRFGLAPEQIDGMAAPVLVRVRTTPVNRAEFARQANAATVAQMSPSEQAKSDAARIDSLEGLNPDDNGDFMTGTSRDFVRGFMARIPGTEQSGMIDAAGNLSQTGYTRLRNAVLAKAYGDSPVLLRMVESLDDNIRNLSKSLIQAAPTVAKARQSIQEGLLFDSDITPDLLAAVEELSRLKDEGKSVHDALAQTGMFGEQYSPETRELLQFLADNIRRPRKIAEFIKSYFEGLNAAGNPNQGSLLGDTAAPAKGDLMNAARRNQDGTEGISQDRQTGQQGGKQREDAPGDQKGAEGNQEDTGPAEGAAAVAVDAPAVAKTDEVDFRKQRYRNINDAEKAIKKFGLKKVGVFKDGDQFKIDTKPGAKSEDFSLTSETPEQVKAKEEAQAAKVKAEKEAADKAEAEDRKERIKKEDADRRAVVMAEREAAKKAEVDAAVEDFQLGQEAPAPVSKKTTTDDLAGQGDIFGGLTQQEATNEQQSIEQLREQLRKAEDQVLLSAGMRDNIEDAMKSRKVPSNLKDKRNLIRQQLRDAQKRLDDTPKQPAPEQKAPDSAKRYEAGSKLTKEERKSVLKTLTDVYRSKRAEKEERIAANGETYLAYPHQPELFEKSDITGKMVRFYVTLPDGRIAHPTELFPDYSQADVDRAIAEQVGEARVADENKKYRLETLNRRMADTLNEANRIFNKENQGRADYTPAILTNGKQFIRTAPENAQNDIALMGGDWRIQEVTEAKPAETPAESKPAKLAPEVAQEKAADVVAQADAIEPAKPSEERIGDFGRKVEVRKDTAVKTGPKMKMEKAPDDRPAWARRIIAMQSKAQQDKWLLMEEAKGGKGLVRALTSEKFDNEQAALDAIPRVVVGQRHRIYSLREGGYGIYRNITDKKRALVKGGFESIDAAKDYVTANAVEIIEHKFDFPERPWLDKIERTGMDHRDGKPVTKQMFIDTFAPGGVVYGNWLLESDGKTVNSDGQELSNYIYDSLLDLADAIKVPPKALFLEGNMVLGIGADGKGGKNSAAAHYSPDKALINLTKIKGAGSLAHEWWHAVDHYFARNAGRKDSHSVVAGGYPYNSTARPELMDAIKQVIDKINYATRSSTTDADLVKQRAKKRIDDAVSSLDYYLRDLRSQVETNTYGSGKKKGIGGTKAQIKQWDDLVAKLRDGDLGEKVYVENPSKMRGAMGFESGKNLVELNAIFKAVTGRGFLRQDPDSTGRRMQWTIKAIDDNKANLAVKEDVTTTAKGRTDYYIEARKIDGDHSSDYWSMPEELGARAFESYIFDKLIEGEKRSDYLVYAVENRFYALFDKKPYPEGDERKDINSAFDNLFNTIQTKETDKGMAMFSRNPGAGMPMPAAKDIADRIAAANKNMPKVRVFASPADLDRNIQTQAALYAEIESAGALSDVEGAAHDGEIYLFSDHLADESRAEHVLAIHEVTHHGLRKVFGAELNPILQSIWANNANVRKQASALGERLGLKSNTAAVEEVLADMKPADLVKLNGWRKLAQFMRDWFQNHGFTSLAGKLDGMLKAGMTAQQQADMLVADVVNAARDWVNGGKQAGKVGGGTMLQRVYHGTPHLWNPEPGFPHGRPRLDKIGTGEGAQAFGWGWYSAESKGVAEDYAKKLSNGSAPLNFDGISPKSGPFGPKQSDIGDFNETLRREIGLSNIQADAITEVIDGDFKSVDEAIETFKKNAETSKETWRKDYYIEISEIIDRLRNRFGIVDNRNLYQLDIPDAALPYLLDWDKQYEDQTEEVRAAWDASVEKYPIPRRISGRAFYAAISVDTGSDKAASEYLASLGIVGNRYLDGQSRKDGEGSYNYVIWDQPTLDKIAMLERNGEKLDAMREADVMLSRASQSPLPGVQQSPPVQPPSQQSANLQGGSAVNQSVFNTPEPSKMDDIIFKLQDKHIDLKRAIQGITDAGRQIADKWNTYMQEELFHGRSAKRVKDFTDRELAPMLREMALRKVSIADLDKFLWARHAKEANALIEQRDPGVMVDDVTGKPKGSGMTDQEADDYFASLSQDQRNQLDAIAKKVDDMLVKTRELYVSYGLEGRDTVQGWADMFQHYVPLMREDHDVGMGIGQGFSIKGRETKHRTGSTRAVADVLANIATQRERAIVRGEKNRVAVSLAGLVKLNPAPDFWTLDKIPQERVLNEKTGQVETREVPNYRTRDNVIIAKIKDGNGNVKERAIVLNERDERAVRLAKSMKNIDIPMLEGWLGSAAAVTRYFSAINTQYNPVFGAINLIRDVGAGALNLSSTALKGKERIVTNPKRIASAVAGIYSDARKERKGQAGTSAWSQLWEDFTEQGGQTGYRDMFKTSNDRADAMQMVMDPTSWTESKWGKFFTANGALKVPLLTAQKAATPLFNWLSDYNLAMENAVRLSAYKEALDSGMSKPQAASLAKNLTVNFNRKGAYGAQAGALYAFFNAATQGSARIGETLTRRDHVTGKYSVSDIGKKIIGGGIMLGAMQAVALAMAGFDDDEPPEFIRERNIVVPLPGGKYLAIPMPLGFHVIPNIGRITAETVMGRRGSAVEAVIDLAGITFEAFNPIGSAGWSMQTVAPTVLDPMAALIENKDWTGKPIAKEKFSDSDPTPGFDMARDNASAIATGIAYAINLATGGSDYTAGRISPTPDQLDYLWGQVTGGVGREFNKLYQTVESPFTGEELPPYKIPLAGRLYGDTQSKSAVSSRYYENIRDMKRHKAEYLGRRENGDAEGAREYLADNPEAKLFRAVGAYESKIQQLRSAKRKAVERGINPDRVKAIEQRTSELMDKFNQQVESAQQ